MDIDVYSPDNEGYEVKHCFENWRVAYLRYAERFDKITYMERHLNTDEIFVLLKGRAALIVNENAKYTEMETYKMYNVRKGVWHNIKVDKNALVLIVENKDTGKDNTEYMPLKMDIKI